MAKDEKDKASEQPKAAGNKVTFLGMRHFKIGNQQFHFKRGDVADFDPEALKAQLIEGKNADDQHGDFIRGAVDLKAHDKKK